MSVFDQRGGWLVFSFIAVAACARMQPPPGGPIDPEPPRLLSVRPESIAVLPRFDGNVEFEFDEIVSEGAAASRGAGTGTLERLVLLSPSTRVPKVRWRRSKVTVSPAEGWQPNRVYRVELLPGMTDLRGNRSDSGAVVTFTTGAPVPQTVLTGTVIDWASRRPVGGALIVAILLPDSLTYRTLADSSGAFSFGPLPRSEYVVYGVIDQNRDLQQTRREAYDSARMAPGVTDVGELWVFERDSAPPRPQSVSVNDSVSATIMLTQRLDPARPFDSTRVQVRRLPDSAVVAVTSLLPGPVDDSLHRRAQPADTVRRDTIPAPRRPERVPPRLPERTTRPALIDRLVLRVAGPWQPGARYLVTIPGARSITGIVSDIQTPLVVPERKPIPADSVRPSERPPNRPPP